MKWQGDLGLELYVATRDYPDSQQYRDSLKALGLIRAYGLKKNTEVISLDNLDGQRRYFDSVKDPKQEIKLPFLVCGFGCETGAFLGFSRLEEMAEMLEPYQKHYPLVWRAMRKIKDNAVTSYIQNIVYPILEKAR